ncbi:MAG TPA: hypothetical protein VHA78_04575 [Candidatus Peribacteraceae bacterium]|nr:hypothetical protein [Candidatus Peribacteraceae bacterium]
MAYHYMEGMGECAESGKSYLECFLADDPTAAERRQHILDEWDALHPRIIADEALSDSLQKFLSFLEEGSVLMMSTHEFQDLVEICFQEGQKTMWHLLMERRNIFAILSRCNSSYFMEMDYREMCMTLLQEAQVGDAPEEGVVQLTVENCRALVKDVILEGRQSILQNSVFN